LTSEKVIGKTLIVKWLEILAKINDQKKQGNEGL